MNEIEIKLELLRMAERIIVARPENSTAEDLKEVYRQLVALYNEKL